MRGIVFTTDGVEITDELEVRDPGPRRSGCGSAPPGSAIRTCRSSTGPSRSRRRWCSATRGPGWSTPVGSEVRSVKPGDHVVIATLASCGTCRACSTGHPTWCRRSLGNIGQPFTFKGEPAHNFAAASVFAEQTVVSEVQAVRIPADVPLTSACLIGCGVLTGVGAVLNRARVRPGETAAVFGVGGVGLNVIQGLRISGATRIVAVDTVAAKEALGRQFGATDFVDATDGDAAAAVRALVPPDRERASGALNPLGGVAWAFDCVGHPAVLRSALDSLDWGGNAVAIGIPPRGTEVAVDVNCPGLRGPGIARVPLRVLAAPPRHPAHGRPLPIGPAALGRAGEPDPTLGRLLRGGGRDARRAGGPGRAHLRRVTGTTSGPIFRVGPMRGVLLAGGTGSRLFPLTRITNKHLLPIYDRPMIQWSIEALVKAGITELMLVTGGTHAGEFLRLLGNGHEFGIDRLSYGYQDKPGGIAEALGLAERFCEDDPVLVMLADNVVEGSIRPMVEAFEAEPNGARILLDQGHRARAPPAPRGPRARRQRQGGPHRREARASRRRTTG